MNDVRSADDAGVRVAVQQAPEPVADAAARVGEQFVDAVHEKQYPAVGEDPVHPADGHEAGQGGAARSSMSCGAGSELSAY